MNMEPKRLQQDVRTRWNSTYYMIESLLEQKRALSAYAADHDLPTTLTANQWTLLGKTKTCLEPFEEFTRKVCSATASAADVIPSVTVLKRVLSMETEADSGIKTMKKTLLEAIDKRFSTVEDEPLYALLFMHFQHCWTQDTKTDSLLVQSLQSMEKMHWPKNWRKT
ncbi:zinc finger BED domain-containing protein 4-like [Sinocyclocheilus anshuiensis]|uniref:zinc finger BED domain-containing protein 4-like n=1 Tax=Sinocyclocheilus anshuiensis TaxID=1608454 RepID=UPI0007B7C29B|nr:PREDICTED: zinc finger BED domain-containing protein 4-like [Sinocyclocheilus anshuiensis]